MRKLALTTIVASFALAGVAVTSASAEITPCEDMLKQLRDAEKTAKLGDADKAKVTELEQKGLERCKADDDKRADGFFEEAIKIVSQK